MNRLWLACFCALGFSGAAQAQTAQVLSGGCGTAGYSNVKGVAQVTQDTTGRGCIISTSPVGTYADGSAAMSTAAATVFAANTSRIRLKLINTDYVTASGGLGIAIWCRWGTAGSSPAAVHAVGSFIVLPGAGIDDQGAGVNQSAVNCIAESGAPILFAEQY